MLVMASDPQMLVVAPGTREVAPKALPGLQSTVIPVRVYIPHSITKTNHFLPKRDVPDSEGNYICFCNLHFAKMFSAVEILSSLT